MLEIEQKYAGADFPAIERRLGEWGAGAPEEHEEADHYFNAPDRDFARTDEAFRLRRVGEKNFLTYKGPKRRAEVKVRTELEVPLPPGEESARDFISLLTHLGYRPQAVVRKVRRSYRVERGGWPLNVCLDEVEGLGRYAELEVVAPEEKAAQVQEVVAAAARAMGLSAVERRSYLGLVLEAKAKAGSPEQKKPAVVRTAEELRQALAEARRGGRTVGLVPTMGALHEGHLSLIESARAQNEFVVVSVFVNPAQFGPHEDLARYPRPLERDLELCAGAGVDLVFHPPAELMYPAGFRTYVEVEGLQDVLEGKSRPGHFRGVCTVVLKLFNLVRPDRAYFGQKDAQQARVVRKMVEDLNVPVEVVVRPTVREPDGLARSSRNEYLDPQQRRHAVALYRALEEARDRLKAGERDAEALRRGMEARIRSTPGAELDYAAVVDADTLQPLREVTRGALLALAVKFGDTRLIDNVLVDTSGG